MANVVKSSFRFASKLYSKLGKSNENSFYSPYSLLSALGMCTAGSRGDTQKALVNLLEVPLDFKDQKTYFKALNAEVNAVEKPYELVSANAIWVQDGFGCNPEFSQTVDDYGGKFVEVNYVKTPDAAVKQINDWCNDATRGKISEIITLSLINQDTRLILTNAIYFKGKWQFEFDKDKTKDADFRSQDGTKKVPTMHQSGTFSYYETPLYQALDLPYTGDDLSMLIILPNIDTTNGIDANIDGIYNEVVIKLHYEEMEISLPRFTMKTEYKLGEALKELGAGVAFSDQADFSGITTEQPLKISEVIHKAFVQCDEEGTKASGATAGAIMTATAVKSEPAKVFKADHPFVLFIRNKNTGNILFCGRVTNPSKV